MMKNSLISDTDIKNMPPEQREQWLHILQQEKKKTDAAYEKIWDAKEQSKSKMASLEGELIGTLKAIAQIKGITNPTHGELSELLEVPLSDQDLLQALRRRPEFVTGIVEKITESIDEKTKKEIQEYEGLTFEEIKKKLSKTKDSDFFKKLSGIFQSGWFRVANAVVVVALGIFLYTQFSSSTASGEGTERVEVSQNSITLEQLQESVGPTHLDPQVSYQEIVNTVNSIPNERVRVRIIYHLMHGQVISAQEYVGMTKSSPFATNRATGVIDELTLSRFADPMTDLEEAEILSHPRIPQDVKNKYRQVLASQGKENEHKDRGILSKTDYKFYTFTADYRLLNVQVGLTGRKPGDTPYQQGSNPTTPEGRYKVMFNNLAMDRSGIQFRPGSILYDKVQKKFVAHPDAKIKRAPALDIFPVDKNGNPTDAYAGSSGIISIHAIPEGLRGVRADILTRLNTIWAANTSLSPYEVIQQYNLDEISRQTGGCICLMFYAVVYDHLGVGTIVFVTSEHRN